MEDIDKSLCRSPNIMGLTCEEPFSKTVPFRENPLSYYHPPDLLTILKSQMKKKMEESAMKVSYKDYTGELVKLGGKVPVVKVAHTDETEDIYGTITHNRARGTHLLEPMKAIVKRLLDDGKTVQEIGRQLGMRPEEVFRLSDFSRNDFLRMMTEGIPGYSKAEVLTKI